MNPSWRRNYLRYKAYFLNVVRQYRERADVKVYLEILLSLLTITIFAVFALRPTLLTIAELIKEIESKEKTITTMDTKIENLSRAQSVYNQQRANIELLNSAIPSEPNPDIFVRQVEGLSAKHQAALRNLSFEKTVILGDNSVQKKGNKQIKSLPEAALGLGFSASFFVPVDSYRSLSSLLNDMERLRRPVKADRLIYSTTQQEEDVVLILTIEGGSPFYQEGIK